MFTNPEQRLFVPLDQETNAAAVLFSASPKDSQWEEHHQEGQLAVDVVNTEQELVIVATMAGTKPEEIELHLHNDFLTIRGVRQSPVTHSAEHFFQECFWGPFSRTIVLPVDVKAEMARAEYRNGLLTIYLPKVRPANTIPIMVLDD